MTRRDWLLFLALMIAVTLLAHMAYGAIIGWACANMF